MATSFEEPRPAEDEHVDQNEQLDSDTTEGAPEALQSSEQLDEDALQVDPLERGVEPPETWAVANGFGVTGQEQRDGASLDERLVEEREDVEP